MSDQNLTRVNEDFLIILRTIVTFLDNHNFKNTLTVLNNECSDLGLKDLTTHNFGFRQKQAPTTDNAVQSSSRIPVRLSEVPSCLKKIQDKSTVTSEPSSNTATVIENSVCDVLECSEDTDKLQDARQSDILSQLCACNLDPEKIKKLINENTKLSSPYFTSSEAISVKQLRECLNSSNQCTMNNCTSHARNNSENPVLNRVPTSTKNFSETELKQDSSEEESSSNYDDLKLKFMTLQDEHRRLMEITAKLTVAFQRNIKGQTENMNTILNNCKEICPELFCPKSSGKTKNCFTLTKEEFSQCITQEFIDLGRKDSSGSSTFSTDTFDESRTTDMKQLDELPADIPSNFQLDFQKLKTDLRTGDINTRLALLQALRWRITRNPACLRTDVMGSYERFDVLDIRNCSHRNDSYPKSKFLDSFYCPKKTPDIIQESIARLINAMASMKTGRDYLTRQSILMNYLLSVLMGTHNLKPKLDSITRDMTIATMQKMSLRYWQRVTMINAGLCKFLIKFLSDNYKKLSSYCLEYSTALLMNLWLHSDARERCRPLVKDIIKLLATLLDIKYENCLPYINGSLYSLLPDPNFHKVAKDVKLGQVIEYRIPTAEADMQEQLRCILKIYHDPSNWQPMCDCDLGVEIENEIDLFEPELDENDRFTTCLSGEQLLYNYRALFPLNGSQVCSSNITLRPMTPQYAKRTSFSVSPMSPYVRDENSIILQDSIINIQYQQLKDFLINKLSTETNPYKEMYFKNDNDNVLKENDSKDKLNGNYNNDNRGSNRDKDNVKNNNGQLNKDNKSSNKDNEEFSKNHILKDNDRFVSNNGSTLKNKGSFSKDKDTFKKNIDSLNNEEFSKIIKDKGTNNDSLEKNDNSSKETSEIDLSKSTSKTEDSSSRASSHLRKIFRKITREKSSNSERSDEGSISISMKETESLKEDTETNGNHKNMKLNEGRMSGDERKEKRISRNKSTRYEQNEDKLDSDSFKVINDDFNKEKASEIDPNNGNLVKNEIQRIKRSMKKEESRQNSTSEKKDASKRNTSETKKRESSSKNRVQKYSNEKNDKDKNNNKKQEPELKIEKEFCEDTQQFYQKPTKNGIFEQDKIDLNVPSFTKRQNYDQKNISLPNTPFYTPGPSDIVQKSCPTTARDVQTITEALYVHPVHLHPSCYRQNYKSICLCNPPTSKDSNSDTTKNNKKVNRYACCCYEKLKQSFEKEHNNENNIRNLSPNRNHHASCNVSCKYTSNCATSIDTNVQSNERDSGVSSRQLDETDYDAVFESRPRILRTP